MLTTAPFVDSYSGNLYSVMDVLVESSQWWANPWWAHLDSSGFVTARCRPLFDKILPFCDLWNLPVTGFKWYRRIDVRIRSSQLDDWCPALAACVMSSRSVDGARFVVLTEPVLHIPSGVGQTGQPEEAQ